MNNTRITWLYVLMLSWLMQLFLPWWAVAFAGITVGVLLGQGSLHGFLSGFIGVGVLWIGVSTYIHIANDGILAGRVAEMMSLPNAFSIILVTGVIGGLVGGLSAMTGYLLRDAFIRPVKIAESGVSRYQK